MQAMLQRSQEELKSSYHLNEVSKVETTGPIWIVCVLKVGYNSFVSINPFDSARFSTPLRTGIPERNQFAMFICFQTILKLNRLT